VFGENKTKTIACRGCRGSSRLLRQSFSVEFYYFEFENNDGIIVFEKTILSDATAVYRN